MEAYKELREALQFMREDRYVVWKLKDLLDSLTWIEMKLLRYLIRRINKGSRHRQYLVIESDWPEYEPTWKAIEARVTGNSK
jgi:hypothetical protein